MQIKQKKVLFLANDTTYTYNLRDEIIKTFVENNYEVVIASQPLLFQDELRSMNVRLIDVATNRHGKNPFADIELLKCYIKLLKKERPDFVLTYNIKPNSYGGIACRITQTPYFPNITGLGTAVEYPSVMQKLTIKLYRTGVAGARCVFFQNEENRSFFLNHNMLKKGCKTVLLPGSGVNLIIHRLLDYPKDVQSVHFLFIARLMKDKGIDLYLNAAKRVYMKRKDVTFHICGYCDDKKYLEILSKAPEYIQYHGEQKDIIPFFQQAHCIVHPSYYPEGMSNVLLEAAAHGRPIIATDRAGCRETVEDGKTGFIIPIKNEDALVSAIEKFLNLSWENKRDMGLLGRKKMEKEFDRRIVARAYLDEARMLKAQ